MMKLINRLFKDGHRCFTCPFLLLAPIILIIVALTVYLIMPVYAVEIVLDGRVVKTFSVEINSEVYIDYTHSVARTNVRDVFIINEDSNFLLTRTEYSSFGAGLPTENYGDFEHKDGLFINKGINMVLPEIPLRIGIIANHKLTFQDEKVVVFSDFSEAGDLVIIKPVKVIRLRVLRI